MYTILICFGTRPELIKLIPVVKKLAGWNFRLVASGQHKELIEPVIKIFDVKIDYNLGCSNIDLIENSNCIITGLRSIIKKEKPDLILFQGDTLTSYVSSFVAFMEKIPAVHLEAGLRSYDKFSPFPEEMFRILSDDLSDIYLVPTFRAYSNLLKESKSEDRIFLIGNTVVDALYMALDRINEEETYAELGKKLNIKTEILKSKPKVLITSHRRESIGEPLKAICRAVKRISHEYPEAIFIWSLHKNPMLRSTVLRELEKHPQNLVLTEALSYTETILMLKDSELILTDSGGIQEEAPAFKKPVLVLRDLTERTETIEYGFGFLVGREEDKIVETFRKVYKNNALLEKLKNLPNPYGDGRASERFLSLLNCEKFLKFVKEYPKSSREVLDECKDLVGKFEVQPPDSEHISSFRI